MAKLKYQRVLVKLLTINRSLFTKDNAQQIVASAFVLQGNKVSFWLDNYDSQKTLVLDPWTQTPNFNLNWENIWECDRDGAGNVYAMGGIMPMQILKYNSAGVLQWTYNTPYDTSNAWLGTFATDLAGNSYITAGSVARIVKINTNAGVVWNNSNPGGILSSAEFWNITFQLRPNAVSYWGNGRTFACLRSHRF
jgi:hypothetical protein